MSNRTHIPAFVRGLVIGRDRLRCRYCRRRSASATRDPDGRAWHLDHVVPYGAGGSDDPSNLALACARCNLSKHAGTAPRTPASAPRRRSAEKRPTGRPRGTGARTIRIVAPIPAGGGRVRSSGRLWLGRALWQQIGSPARIDVVRDGAGRLRIRAGARYAVIGADQDTIPRVSIGQRVLDTWGLAPGYYAARVYRGGIVVGAPHTS